MICSYWGDTHIYQEGSISPPCMVLLQSEQQEESVLLVNGEALSSQEKPKGSKSQPPSPGRARVGSVLSDLLLQKQQKKHASHHLKWFLIWACVRYTRQSMRKYKAQSRVTAEKCHKSSCLSSCIFKAECSQWLWVLAARPSVISQRESKPTVEITPTVRRASGDAWTVLGPLGLISAARWESNPDRTNYFLSAHLTVASVHLPTGQSNKGWHVGKHYPQCQVSLSLFLTLTLSLSAPAVTPAALISTCSDASGAHSCCPFQH